MISISIPTNPIVMYVFLVPFLNSIIKDASDYLSTSATIFIQSSFQSVFTIYVSIKSTENKKRSPDKFKVILD